MDRRFLTALLLLGTSCATTPGGEVTPEGKTHRLTNLSEFDVMVCHAPRVAVPVHERASVQGALHLVRPLILECLVDPKSRGEAGETQVTVDTTVTDAGARHQVSGTNLTPTGVACVEQVLARSVQLLPLAPGAKPVTAQLQVEHSPRVSPTVRMGVNEPSDIIGTIRLAQSSWCDCFAPYASTVPAPLKATVTVEKDATRVSSVSFTPVGTPGEDTEALARCLTTRLQSLELPKSTRRWELPYTFEFINTLAEEPAADAAPPTRMAHLDSRRDLLLARAALAIGERTGAVNAYSALIDRYNDDRRSVSIEQLAESCQALVARDDAWLARLE